MQLLLKTIWRTDYSFLQKVIPLIGFIGLVSHLPFYILLKYGFGFRESLPLRLAITLGAAILIWFPRQRVLRFFHKAYFETIVAVSLPFAFTWLWLLNADNSYWFASVAFAGMAYGLMTKPYLFPITYPLSSIAAILLFRLDGTHSVIAGSECLKVGIVGYFTGFLSNAIKTALEGSHYRILEEREKNLHIEHALQLSMKETEQAKRTAEESQSHAVELNRIIKTLQSYTRPSLVAYIERGQDPRAVLPSEKDFTILNCDLRDFTGLTERMEPQEQIKLLNSYFSMMTDSVERNNGEMDKFIGDAFMALFDDPSSAGFAAMDCRRALQTYNKHMLRENPGYQVLQNGIGIARGMVTHGNIGSLKKLDLTVVGSAANISARLESLTKKYNVDILVTEDIVRAMGGYKHCRWIDQVKVRGSKQGLRIYELYGHQAEVVVQYKDDTKELLEKALNVYFQKGFRDAERMFSALLEKSPPHRHLPDQPMDRIYLFYLMRCERNRSDANGYERMLREWNGYHEFAE